MKNRVAMIMGATLASGALSVGLGLSTHLFVFLAFELMGGLVVPFFATTSMTVLQETVEPQMQGRVFGFVGIVTAISMPIGIGVCGPLADRFTVESVLVASGVIMFLVVATASPCRRGVWLWTPRTSTPRREVSLPGAYSLQRSTRGTDAETSPAMVSPAL